MKLAPYPEYKDSDVPWLGKVPAHWNVVKLRRVVSFNPSKSETRANPADEAKVVFLPMEKISASGRIDCGEKRPLSEVWSGFPYFRRGDVVVAKITPCFENGKGAYLKWLETDFGFGTTELIVLRPSETIDGAFLRLITSTKRFLLLGKLHMTGAAGQQRIPTDFVKNYLVGLPAPSEQDRIARFLDWKTSQINKFIRNKRRLIELLKEQRQNVINQAVTRGLDPNVRLKPSGVEWIGDIPEHWEVRRLRTLAAVRPSGLDKNSNESEVPVMLCNYVDVYKNDRITSTIDFMKATATPDEIRALELKAGDVIITKDSESWDDIAVPSFVPEAMPGVVCAYHLALVRPFAGKIEGEYLFRAFAADPIADQFRVAATGVTRFGLAQGAINGAFFPLPSMEEQRAIVDHISRRLAETDQAITRAQREIELMREYRIRLISDVVTGQVDVRGIKVPEVAEDELLALEDDAAESDEVVDDEGEMDESD